MRKLVNLFLVLALLYLVVNNGQTKPKTTTTKKDTVKVFVTKFDSTIAQVELQQMSMNTKLDSLIVAMSKETKTKKKGKNARK